jgi:hypothetical protein
MWHRTDRRQAGSTEHKTEKLTDVSGPEADEPISRQNPARRTVKVWMNSLNPAPFQTHSIGNVLAELPKHYLNIVSDEIAFVDGIANAKWRHSITARDCG